MGSLAQSVLHCMRHQHDQQLMLAAALVCTVGVYATFAVANHAARSTDGARRVWGAISIVASGCTAWATHFIVLLAFRPGTPAAFEPLLTASSLLFAILGIGAGVTIAVAARTRGKRFLAGFAVGSGVAALHYVGQAAYVVEGVVSWNLWLVVPSIIVSLPISGLAMMAVAVRKRRVRALAAPLLLLSIALMHFCGMAAMTIRADAGQPLPADAISPATITPVVAAVCIGLLALAVIGWRLDLSAKARIRKDRQRLRELADVALEGLLVCDGDRIVTANSSIERLSGYSAGALSESFISALLPGIDIPTLPEREEREAELMGFDGQPVPVRVLRCEVPLGHKRGMVIAVRDQRERLRTEARLNTLAFSDSLTGLPNRKRFSDLLAAHAAASDSHFSLLVIGLDRFKPINDALGHAAGDTILRKVADRLRSILREDDIVARLGGDEFAVLRLDAGTSGMAEEAADRIIDHLTHRPFSFEGQLVFMGASVGIASSPADGNDPAELLRSANLALDAAKTDGRGVCRRYDAALDERTRERRALEAGLRRALVNGEFELHYQPLVDARSGSVCSAEALIRWRDPERGLIAPAQFIDLAEETGLILPIGEWVLRTACREAATWPDAMGVAVNLSPAQFREPALAETVAAALCDAGLSPDRLELEITEGVLLVEEKRTLETLTTLRRTGVHLAMDDFGTGYSSLSSLRRFPFDKIKIDQSFVRQLPHDAESAAIVRAIITMGHCMGMSTTVEGVETSEQFDFSATEGCDTIQGYHVSRPLPADQFAAFVRDKALAARATLVRAA